MKKIVFSQQLLSTTSPKAKALIKDMKEAGLSGDDFDEMVNSIVKYDFKNTILTPLQIKRSLK